MKQSTTCIGHVGFAKLLATLLILIHYKQNGLLMVKNYFRGYFRGHK